MNKPDERLSKLEQLNSLVCETSVEQETVWLLHRMSQVVLELVHEYQQADIHAPERDDLIAALIEAFELFYEAYCTVWERKYQRACKIWWALTEAILQTLRDDFDLVFHFWCSLRWISFAPQKRDLVETDQLIRLILDNHLGPDLIDCFIEDEDDPDHQLEDMREAARHYLEQTTGPGRIEWLDQQISRCLGNGESTSQ